ncbi:MAG: hypothetical protein K2I06_01515 [Ruminococcus sp.]|nr:hypothetical protein [Ruminococcus sp.]
MDEYKLYELQCLRGKISSIIGRFVVSLVLSFLLHNDSTNGIMIMYIMVSWYWIFVKLTGNWIIGIILGFVAFALCAERISNMSGQKSNVWAFILLFGLIIIDVINVIRYFVLKTIIIKDGISIRRLSKAEMKKYKK